MTKKKQTKKPARAPRAELSQEEKDAKAISTLLGDKDAEGAAALTRQFMPEGALGRVNAERPEEYNDITSRYKAASEAYGPGGGARRSAESQDVLDQYKGKLSRSGEMQGILDRFRTGTARTGEDAEYLGRLKGGLGGYSSEENQAALEQQMRESNSAYDAAKTQLSQNAGKLGVRGGTLAALSGKIDKQSARDQLGARQDIFLKNADEKQKRLETYGSEVGRIQGDEQGRTKDYSNLLRDTEREDNTRLDAYAGMVKDAETTEFDKGRLATGDYFNTLKTMRDDELGRQKTNMDQAATERAGQASTYFGGLERGAAVRSQEEEKKLNRGYYNMAKKAYGGGRGDGRTNGYTGRGPTTATAPNMDEYYAERERLINERYK